MAPAAQEGVSVIICCYNSSSRLLPTLTALTKQEFSKPINWEIIIVDNASTDNTALVAAEIWESFLNPSGISFRVVTEKKPGQAFARRKGISSASFGFILFCDDDNWLSGNYVEGVYHILNSDDSLAACGGLGVPVFETSKPFWFDEYAEAYAVGSQYITMDQGRIISLYGAGMAVKKDALYKLDGTGFKPVMAGRTETSLSSSDDTELSYALVLMGYRLHFNPEIHFSHFLPEKRLAFTYLQNLYKAFGKDGPVLNLYYSQITRKPMHWYIRYWPFHLLLGLTRLVKYLVVPPKRFGRSVYFQWSKAYLHELLRIRRNYTTLLTGITGIHPVKWNVSAPKNFKLADQ